MWHSVDFTKERVFNDFGGGDSVQQTKKRWFMLNESQVLGPFDEGEIESQVSNVQNPLIWGRGLSEWIPPMQWREALKDPQLAAITSTVEPLWKYRQDDREFGPMPYSEMINALKKIMDYAGIQVWNETTGDWQEIYLVAKVSDELGVSRRVHPRVPIMGTLQCETSKGPVTVKIISISEGGLGASEANQLKIGEKYRSVLMSPNLYVNVNCTVEVMYVGNEGYSGLRFVNLPIESKSAVIEYVNKFKDIQK